MSIEILSKTLPKPPKVEGESFFDINHLFLMDQKSLDHSLPDANLIRPQPIPEMPSADLLRPTCPMCGGKVHANHQAMWCVNAPCDWHVSRMQSQVKPNEELRAAIAEAASKTDPNPTEAEKKSGTYKKGKFQIFGMTVAIENAKGSTRSGIGKDGKPWNITMRNHYGYFLRTESEADGDHIDVFIGPTPESETIYVIDQLKETGGFDEHKCMVGFTSEAEAKQAYLANYAAGWTGFGGEKAMSVEEFKEWVKGNTAVSVTGVKSIDPNDVEKTCTFEEAGKYGNGHGTFVGSCGHVIRRCRCKITPDNPHRTYHIVDRVCEKCVNNSKAMSYLSETSGGALVPPPAFTLKPKKKIKGLRVKYKKLIRSEEEQKGLTTSVQSAGKWLAKKWAALESRYGRRAALTMALASIATLPLPGNVTVIIAAAEAIRGLHNYFQNNMDMRRLYPKNESEEHWVTLPNGTHVEMDGKGEIDKGPQIKPKENQKSFNYHKKDWITIGGIDKLHNGRDEHHHGGTPVEIDDDGKIRKGPEALRGRKISDLRNRQRLKPPTVKPPPQPVEKKPEPIKAEEPTNKIIPPVVEPQKENKWLEGKKPKDVKPNFTGVGTDKFKKDRIEILFGKKVDDSSLGAMANGFDGCKIEVYSNINARTGHVMLQLLVNEKGVRSHRIIKETEAGEIVCHNELFVIDDNSPYKGKGVEFFASQVAALKEANVDRIKTQAAGYKGGRFNGYYTWPRMGYDGTIRTDVFENLPEEFQKKMGKSRSVLDLFELPGGKEAWKEYGNDIYDAYFDLSDDSRSMKVLKAYLEERKNRGKEATKSLRIETAIKGTGTENRRRGPQISSGTKHLTRGNGGGRGIGNGCGLVGVKSQPEEHWITLEPSGMHVKLDGKGQVKVGPSKLVGWKPKNPTVKPSTIGEQSKPEPTKAENPQKEDKWLDAKKPKDVELLLMDGQPIEWFDSFFGKHVEKDAFEGMANAFDKAEVRVYVDDSLPHAPIVKTSVYGKGVSAKRAFLKEDNKLIAINQSFSIEEDSPYKGKGVEFFVNQVAALKKVGANKIITHAAGRKGDKFNGYYTWPRMGYDGTILSHQFNKLPQNLQDKLGNSRSVLDLFELEGGKEAWKKHGSDIYDAHFDLEDNSRSMKALKAYLEERKNRDNQPKEKSLPIQVKNSPEQVLAAVNQMGRNFHGLIPIHELGKVVGTDPETLHSLINQLRRQGKLTVAGAEGRFGNTEEARRWYMKEPGGHDIGYVMLKQ